MGVHYTCHRMSGMDDRSLVLEMIAYIERRLTNGLEARDLVDWSGYSFNRLRQKFFAVTGDTPSGYLRKRRLTEAAKELLAGERIVDVALKYGYSSQDNFTTAFRSRFGVTPKELSLMDAKYRRFIANLREVYSIMELTDLKQPPFCSTLMGSLKGAADWFDLDLDVPLFFGLSGHAFLINMHKTLCPSGPYAWDKAGFKRCLANLGILIKEEFWFDPDTSLEKREQTDSFIRASLNEGKLAMLEFLEYQLINGFDETGYTFALPWNGQADSERKRLSFGSWEECLGPELFVGFKLLEKGELRADFPAMLRDALDYGLDLWKNPTRHVCSPDYGIGFDAWSNWEAGVKTGHGGEHGNWWNAMVWAENREMGAAFFEETADLVEGAEAAAAARAAAAAYRATAPLIRELGERERPDAEKLERIVACRAKDAEFVKAVGALRSAM